MINWLKNLWKKEITKEECFCNSDEIYRDCEKIIFKCKYCGKEKIQTGIFHDWEVVEKGNIAKVYEKITDSDYGANQIIFLGYFLNYSPPYKEGSSFHIKRAKNGVCLRCGECHHGIDEMKDKYLEQKKLKEKELKEKQDRIDIAKKMFKDGCNNK